MINEEINKTICKWMGRDYHKPTPAEVKRGSYYQYEPDFTGDLNTIHEAEKTLTEEQQAEYWHTLEHVTLDPVRVEYPDAKLDEFNTKLILLFSTAQQRAEALLRVIQNQKPVHTQWRPSGSDQEAGL